MCSRSIFVTTAIDGHSIRNDLSLSSASATMYSLSPNLALLPNTLNRPPITAVGSRPPRSSTRAIIDVVVVFPCEPATAIAKCNRISSASISARGMTGIPLRSASTISGFVFRTADETTTTSASPTCPAACPSNTLTLKRCCSRAVTSDPFTSEPLISYPRFASSSAIPLIPMPPMPTKCTRRVRPSICPRRGPVTPAPCPPESPSRRELRRREGGSPCKLQHLVHDDPRGIRPRHAPGAAAHRQSAWFVSCQRQNFRGEALSCQLTLIDQSRRTLRDERLGVLALV